MTTQALTRLSSTQADFVAKLDQLLNRDSGAQESSVDADVAAIIADVITRGDTAVFDYTERFDGFALSAQNIEVPAERLDQALASIPAEQREALEYAAQRVRNYHEHQLQESWNFTEADGCLLYTSPSPRDS